MQRQYKKMTKEGKKIVNTQLLQVKNIFKELR